MGELPIEKQTAEAKPFEPLFSKKRVEHVKDVFWINNPIAVQILGVCSALAVTVQVKTALVMSLALTFVVCLSNVSISLIRKWIPQQIRIVVFLVVVASLVSIIDQILKAYLFQVSKQLSVFVGLIITNCIVMGRLEAFAMGNDVWDSFLDGLGNSLGYSLVLLTVAIPRELFGSGKLFGIDVIPASWYEAGYSNTGLMLLAPAAFILLGLFVWAHREIDQLLRKGKK